MIEIVFIITFFPMMMMYAAISDCMTMRIPNSIPVFLVAGFFMMSFMVGLPLLSIGEHLLVAVLVLAVSFILFEFKYIGGGDAKLMSAVALWFGPVDAFSSLLLSSIYGGVLTLALMSIRGKPLPLFLSYFAWVRQLYYHKDIPYGIAISVGSLQVYLSSSWMDIFTA